MQCEHLREHKSRKLFLSLHFKTMETESLPQTLCRASEHIVSPLLTRCNDTKLTLLQLNVIKNVHYLLRKKLQLN